jgi:hypothetical protein
MYYDTSNNVYIQMGCMGKTHSKQRFKSNDDKFLAWLGCGCRRPASCGSFVDDIFVAQKQASLSFIMVGEKEATEIMWVSSTFICLQCSLFAMQGIPRSRAGGGSWCRAAPS